MYLQGLFNKGNFLEKSKIFFLDSVKYISTIQRTKANRNCEGVTVSVPWHLMGPLRNMSII